MKKTMFCAALLVAALGCVSLAPTGVAYAAETGGEVIYDLGEFDSFFTKDYDLTLRSYNTFTSVAGSDIAPNDNHCKVGTDVLHADNRALIMDYTPASGSGFNTFFTLFSRSLSSVSSQGGTFEISFDFYPQGWDDPSVISLDKKLWFMLEGKAGTYFVAADKTAINEPAANSVDNLSDFPASDLTVDRRVTYSIPLTAAEAAATNAVTFFFYNAMGKTEAYLDNFTIRYNGVDVLGEGTFENFDLAVFACPSADNQNALDNYGVSARSELEEYSPAMLWDDGGNKVLRMQKGQSVLSTSYSGSLVDFTLGGQYLFPNEGTYTLSADVKLDYETYAGDGLELSFSDFSSTQASYFVNLFAGGEEQYASLPASETLSGWKHMEFTFSVTKSNADEWNCLTLVFDTANGGSTLYMDNLTLAAAGEIEPQIYWTSATTYDRAERQDLRLNTNLGALPAEVSFAMGGETYTASGAQVSQSAGFITLRSAFFDAIADNGTGTLTVAAPNGQTAQVGIMLTGENAAPAVSASSYPYTGKGDLSVGIDLKGKSIVSVTNEGIRLTGEEYALSADKTQLILRESYLQRLSGENNSFTVVTDGGECTFNVAVEAEAGGGGNAALYWGIGGGAAALVIAAVVTAVLLRNRKRKHRAEEQNPSDGGSDDTEN